MVRTVVKEELIPLRKEMVDLEKRLDEKIDVKFWRFEENMDQKLDDTYRKYKDDVLSKMDEFITEVRTYRDEQDAHQLQHHDLNTLPQRIEDLERIHPNNQHI